MARMTMTDTFLSFFSFLPRTTSSFFWVPFIKQASKQETRSGSRIRHCISILGILSLTRKMKTHSEVSSRIFD